MCAHTRLEIEEVDLRHGGANWRTHVLDFSSNMNPLGPPPVLHELLREAVELQVYQHYPDVSKVIEAVAEIEEVDLDDVVVASGASTAIHILFREVLQPDVVVLQDLTYSDYLRYSTEVRKRVVVPSYMYEDKIVLDLDMFTETVLRECRASRRALAVLVTPNNPTGVYVDLRQVLKLAETLHEHGISLLVDISFIDFVQYSRASLRSLLELENVYIVKSYTKILACPGLRIGVIMHRRASETIPAPSWPISTLVEYVFTKLFTVHKRDYLLFLEQTRRYVQQERARMVQALRGLGLKVYSSDTHFFLVEHEENLDKLLLERGILVRHVCKLKSGRHFYRVSIRDSKADDALVATLRDVIARSRHCS